MLYAAFGIFTNHETMERIVGSDAEFLGVGYVDGWRLEFRGCADTEECDDSTLRVALWEITDEHLKRLDRIEGYPRHYTREKVSVTTPDGDLGSAWMYTMVRKGRRSAEFGGMTHSVLIGHLMSGLGEDQVEAAVQRALRDNPNGEYDDDE